MQVYVPVVSNNGQRLMPTTNRKADKLVRQGRAIRRFDRGLFYIVLLDRSSGYTQPIAAGIDPGSKKEGITLKSEAHTYLNIQADAVTWVRDHEEISTTMRRSRRSRQTPYREMRSNRNQGQFRLPPSTRARWGWKLRLCHWLARYYPIKMFIVEDVAAVTKPGKRRLNKSFSPLAVGSNIRSGVCVMSAVRQAALSACTVWKRESVSQRSNRTRFNFSIVRVGEYGKGFRLPHPAKAGCPRRIFLWYR